MPSDLADPPDRDGRVDPRTNMFMAAMIHADGAATPARIRNMSVSGAMVEAAVLPFVGTEVRLIRGGLSASGRVLWRAGNRCGLRFTGSVSVADWMAPPGNGQQRRVDAVVALVKSGAVMPFPDPPQPASDNVPLATDLALVRRLIETLGEALADDPETVRRCASQLQLLDLAGQTLTALAQAAGGGDDAGLARLADLRRSCAQALDG